MKKIIHYIIPAVCFLVCLAMTSCDDFLDKQEDEQLTFDKIWLSRNDTRKYWLNAMSYLPDENSIDGYGGAFLGSSDECSIAWDRNYRMINFGTWNASNIPFSGELGIARYYNGIHECNIFLQNADRCSDPILSKAQLDQWKIQARFMRAYYYFMMMRIYGPVFLMGDELVDFNATTQALYRPRNTWEECVNYVVSEMEACIASPDMKDTWENDLEYGLANKWVCQAVIARLLIYNARPLFNGNRLYKDVKNPQTPDFPELSGKNLFPTQFEAGKWLKAAEAAYKIISSGKYTLYKGSGTTFDDYCANYYGITQEHWNQEIIWSGGYKSRYYWGVSTVPTSVGGTAYGAVGPTQQQVDAYPMNATGRFPITGYDRSGNPVVDLKSGYNAAAEMTKSSWSYPCKGWSTLNNFNITAPNMYKDRDPRFYVTVFFGGNDWIHGSTKTTTSFALGANGNKSHDYPKPGYLVNRFYDHTQNSADSNWGNITFPDYRLGEIYLNFIEAVLECKRNNVNLPAGYDNEAQRVWNDLRGRVGLSAILTSYPEYSWDTNVNELIELYRRERRVELAFERHRYFDTRTWMIAKDTDAGPMYGMDTTFPKESDTATPDGFWNRTVFETRVFNDNHYLFPFSQRELDRNKLLTQNYGW